MEVLSKVPSEAIYQLLSDLEAIERNPKYSVDMNTWADESADGTCDVCLGGAMLVRAVGDHKRNKEIMELPDDGFGSEARMLYRAAKAADALRRGFLHLFVCELTGRKLAHLDTGYPIVGFGWTHYEKNPEIFKRNLQWIAEKFEELEEEGVL